MHELPDEPRRAKLPPELERLRRIDQELHIQAAKAAGLSEAQAVAHTAEHMEERAAEEYRAPSDHGHPGTKSTAYRRAAREAEQAGQAGEPEGGAPEPGGPAEGRAQGPRTPREPRRAGKG